LIKEHFEKNTVQTQRWSFRPRERSGKKILPADQPIRDGSCVELFLFVCCRVLIVLKNMASTESDTRTSREDSIRSPKFDDDDSPEHLEKKRPLDGDSDLSDRKKSHFTGGELPSFFLIIYWRRRSSSSSSFLLLLFGSSVVAWYSHFCHLHADIIVKAHEFIGLKVIYWGSSNSDWLISCTFLSVI
jgi:hypothetical protein